MPHLGKGLWIDKGKFEFRFVSPSTYDVYENQTAVGTLQASEPSFYMNGGPDGASFDINMFTGVVTFLVAPDFENPTDADHDNIYHFIVTALSIGSGSAIIMDVYVTVLDVSENSVLLTFDYIASANNLVGDATEIFDWNKYLFTDGGSTGTQFTSVVVVGDTVQLFGGANIALGDSLFSTDYDGYGHLISIEDTGCIIEASYNTFGDYYEDSEGTILETALLPALVTAGEGCFYNSSGSGQLVTVDFSSLVTAGVQCFQSCSGLTTLSLPVCTDLGGTTGNDSVFAGITGKTITLTIPAALETDGDVVWLCDPLQGNTITIIHP